MVASTEPALTIFVWGNTSRADDGAGPLLADRVRAVSHPRVALIEDMQLQIEHVADIKENVPILFIDASVVVDDGIGLQKIAAQADHSVSTHALSPQALLRLYESTMRRVSPPAWQLHVAATQFGLGESLSEACRESMEKAWRFLETLLGEPDSAWVDALEQAGEGASDNGPPDRCNDAA